MQHIGDIGMNLSNSTSADTLGTLYENVASHRQKSCPDPRAALLLTHRLTFVNRIGLGSRSGGEVE